MSTGGPRIIPDTVEQIRQLEALCQDPISMGQFGTKEEDEDENVSGAYIATDGHYYCLETLANVRNDNTRRQDLSPLNPAHVITGAVYYPELTAFSMAPTQAHLDQLLLDPFTQSTMENPTIVVFQTGGETYMVVCDKIQYEAKIKNQKGIVEVSHVEFDELKNVKQWATKNSVHSNINLSLNAVVDRLVPLQNPPLEMPLPAITVHDEAQTRPTPVFDPLAQQKIKQESKEIMDFITPWLRDPRSKTMRPNQVVYAVLTAEQMDQIQTSVNKELNSGRTDGTQGPGGYITFKNYVVDNKNVLKYEYTPRNWTPPPGYLSEWLHKQCKNYTDNMKDWNSPPTEIIIPDDEIPKIQRFDPVRQRDVDTDKIDDNALKQLLTNMQAYLNDKAKSFKKGAFDVSYGQVDGQGKHHITLKYTPKPSYGYTGR